MAMQVIDTTTNNGSYIGDPAKTAFDKVNSNFSEVYPLAKDALPRSGGALAGNLSFTGGYRVIDMAGGNSKGYIWGDFPTLSDGIHLGYNYYSLPSTGGIIPVPGGGTSRISLGYGSIILATGATGQVPYTRVSVNNSGVAVVGNITATGTINPLSGFDQGSSRKLKNIDGPIPYGLAEVEHMELVVGRYKPEYNDDKRRRLFFVAEQLAELVPEAVDLQGVEFNGERVPSIKLEQILPVLTKAIQELSTEVHALKAKMNGVPGVR